MFGTQGKLLIRYGTADSVPLGYKAEQFRLCGGHHGAAGYGMYIKEAEPAGEKCSAHEQQDKTG